MPLRLTVIAAFCLTAPAHAQPAPYQFLVIYETGSTSPKAMFRSQFDRPECEREAAARSARWQAEGYRVKCEVRGPNDMIWKLWGLNPERVK